MKKKVKAHLVKSKEIIENYDEAFLDIKEGSIDPDNNIIGEVCVFGTRESKNKRLYSTKAVDSLTALTEGTKCFADHPNRENIKQNDGVRSIRDWIGVFEGVRRVGDKVIANLKCRESYFDLLKEVAMMAPKGIGMSINSTVKVFQDKDGLENVVDVVSLKSADLVTSAATCDNLWESFTDKINENYDETNELLLDMYESKIADMFKQAIIDEGIIQDKLDTDEIKSEISDITWTANNLIHRVLNDENMSVSEKKKKVSVIFDDLAKEIKKRTAKIKESMEEEIMDLNKLKTEHPELVEEIIKESKKENDVEKIKYNLESVEADLVTAIADVEEMKTTLSGKETEIEDLNKKVTTLESDKKDLALKLDDIEVAEKLTAKKAMVEKALVDSKLPDEAKTDLLKSTLMDLQEKKDGDTVITIESQIQAQIDDRMISAKVKTGKVKNSGDEFIEKETKETKEIPTGDDLKNATDDFVSKVSR